MIGGVSTPTLPRPARTAGRIFAWVLAAALLILVLMAAWVGVRGMLAYQHLQRIQSGAAAGTAALADDPSAAAPTLARLAVDASSAAELTSDPVWSLAERMPWIGPQLAAFHTVAASSDELLRESLLPLSTAAQGISLDTLRPTGGRIDTSALGGLAAPAEAAATRSAHAASAVQRIDRTPLLAPVGAAVDQADDLFTQVSTAVDTLSRTSQLLPTMFGQNGPRTYLVLVQNNAEWRSLGGMTGTAILLGVDNGTISLRGSQSATALSRLIHTPAADLPADITQIYDTKPARYFHNLTQIPDFTIDGPMAREAYRLATGSEVDGVLAIDPVVLSYLLKATGPVALPTGDTLAADNTVPLLLNEVYLRYAEPAAQDAFFGEATSAVFQALADGRGSASGIIDALTRAGEQHRLLLWSAHPEEQALIDGTVIAGQLPVTDEHTARFGVYLNDGTGSKMSYYVKPDVSLAWGACQPAGQEAARQLTLQLTLTSTAPADAATSLPAYITGGGTYGTPPGVAEVVGNVYLPQGFELVSARATNGAGFAGAMLDDRRVLTFNINLDPGASTGITVIARATTTAAAAQAFVTPTADAALSPVVAASCGLG